MKKFEEFMEPFTDDELVMLRAEAKRLSMRISERISTATVEFKIREFKRGKNEAFTVIFQKNGGVTVQLFYLGPDGDEMKAETKKSDMKQAIAFVKEKTRSLR